MSQDELRNFADLTCVPVRALSTAEVAAIESTPQGQPRTARYKKAVRMTGALVFKGPYRGDDAALVNSLRFSHAIQILEVTLGLRESDRGALLWEFLGAAPGGHYYLAAANVGCRGKVPCERISSRIETDVLVVPRRAAVDRVSDLEKTGGLTAEVKQAALQHLYFRYLLGIGDSGTHNILVRQDTAASRRLIAGIDLEERRKVHRAKRRLDHLFKKPGSRRQVLLYGSDVCRIKQLSGLSPVTLAALSTIGVDVERLVENMQAWHRLD
jgi:hypothetical protein